MIPCRAVDRLERTLRDRTLLHAEILEGNLGHLCNRWHCCTCRSCLRERALRRCAERLRLRTRALRLLPRARRVALRRCADRPRLALRRPLRPPLPPRATARRNRSAPRRPPRRPEGAPLQVPPSARALTSRSSAATAGLLRCTAMSSEVLPSCRVTGPPPVRVSPRPPAARPDPPLHPSRDAGGIRTHKTKKRLRLKQKRADPKTLLM